MASGSLASQARLWVASGPLTRVRGRQRVCLPKHLWGLKDEETFSLPKKPTRIRLCTAEKNDEDAAADEEEDSAKNYPISEISP